jgi:tRNA-dihydrouridine synthase B
MGMFRDLQLEKNRCLCTIPQILSGDAREFLHISEMIGDLGYGEINWNIGCPYPMVTKKGAGAGILPFPDRVDRFLDTVMGKTKLQLSIKMRIGLTDGSEMVALWPVLNRYPIAEITVHPRTAKQMYNGRANVGIFEECVSRTEHQLIYNGDIETVADFEELTVRLPSIHSWMIGRGALRDPFLPGKIKGNEAVKGTERGTIGLFHHRLFEEYRRRLDGPGHLLAKMQTVWSYLCDALPGNRRFAKRIKKARNIEQYEKLMDGFFRE